MKNKEIVIDQEILSGTPGFSWDESSVQSLFDWLETETLDEFPENFPSVACEQATHVLRLVH